MYMYMIHLQSQAAGTSSSISATPQHSSAASMIPRVIVETVEQMEVPSSLLSPIEKVYTCTFVYTSILLVLGFVVVWPSLGFVVSVAISLMRWALWSCGHQCDALGFVVAWPSV